jgi:hypothetical protein
MILMTQIFHSHQMLKIPNYPFIKSASIQSLQFSSGNKPMARFAIVGQEEEVGDEK